MGDQNDIHSDDDLVQSNTPADDTQGLRRRDFIRRLAKAGAIAPSAALLYHASSTPAAAGD